MYWDFWHIEHILIATNDTNLHEYELIIPAYKNYEN